MYKILAESASRYCKRTCDILTDIEVGHLILMRFMSLHIPFSLSPCNLIDMNQKV